MDNDPELAESPHLKLLSCYIDGRFVSAPRDLVEPNFDADGMIIPDDRPIYTLEENAVFGDDDYREAISPYFSSVGEAEDFFKQKFPLYFKYLIDLDDRFAEQVSNYASTVWNSIK